jgi:hypothetical protein
MVLPIFPFSLRPFCSNEKGEHYWVEMAAFITLQTSVYKESILYHAGHDFLA